MENTNKAGAGKLNVIYISVFFHGNTGNEEELYCNDERETQITSKAIVKAPSISQIIISSNAYSPLWNDVGE